ncbi:MAG: branched-chain amino acid ABC transporter permease [Deltaproteobacteria bacterium]|nr:branched-chain amino acid ABC transporter permease [Deltaproteobacteria bacterium]
MQYGLLLFLLSTGLTLIFGVMGVINLAHGSFFMIGAYGAFYFTGLGLDFPLMLPLALATALAIGLILELTVLRPLYDRDPLSQVMLTFGLILVLNESVSMIFGPEIKALPIPEVLQGVAPLWRGHGYPIYRLFVTATGLAVGAALWVFIHRTRLGMIIRAGAVNREMVGALGINIRWVFSGVFALGAGLAALSGLLAAPILSLYPGMGEEIIILTFVVVVVGGLGSLRGALIASLLIGVADTFGKAVLPQLSSVLVYALMVGVLLIRPHGLFSRGEGA